MDNKDLKKLLEDIQKSNKLTKEQEQILARLKRQAKDAQKAARESQDSFEEMKRGLDDVGENFGIRIGQIFDQVEVEVEQASRDIASMFDDLAVNAPEIAAEIAEEFNGSFRNALPDSKDIQAKINLNDIISQFKAQFPEMGVEMQKAFKTGDIANFYKKFGDEGMKNLQRFMKDKKGFDGLKEWFKKGGEGEKSAENFRKKLEEFEPAAQKTTKVVANWGNLFRQIGDNILNHINLRGMIDYVMEFDNKLSNIKREFGIPAEGFGKADAAMQGMVKQGVKFGLTMEQSFQMVKNLGDSAKSNNVQFLAETSQALAAIPQSTGMAVETVADLAGKMMFFGASSEQARKSFTSIQNASHRFGLNITKVGKTFSDVFPRFARMGFKGGEESLARMAAKAEKMGVDLNKTFDMSEKFLDLNTALEASADLSLLGGMASQVSFTDLMRAAEEGGEALMDLTNKMTSDIGKIGPDGLVKLTGMERRRLQAIAQATGQDTENLVNQLTSRLQDQAKMASLPPGVFDRLGPEEKDFLLSKMVNKGGKWKFEGLSGIQDLKTLTPQMIQAQMNAGAMERKNAEIRAQQTQSYQETMTAFIEGLKAEMLKFRPLLDSLKKVFLLLQRGLDGFEKFIGNIFGAKAGSWAKPLLILSSVLMLTMGPSAIAKFFGSMFKFFATPIKSLLSGLGSKIGSIFKGGGKKATEQLAGQISTKATPDLSKQFDKIPKKGPTVLQQFAKINPASILSLAAAVIALGVAFLLIGKGIQFAATGFATLVKSFNETKNAGMALGAIIVVMGGFVAMLALMPPIIAALGTAGTYAAPGLLAFGASILMVGGGIYFAAKGFSMLIGSFMQLGKYSGSLFRAAMGMIGMGGALAIISPALLLFGAAGLIAAPGMVAFSMLLNALAAAKGVNPKIISQIGNSMGSIAWGLVKLGLAAGPATAAIVSGAALMVVAAAFKNLSVVDPKKIVQFGQGLGAISAAMIKGLVKLGLVSPYAILGAIAAGGIWLVSKALANISVVDTKKIENFGLAIGKVGSKMMWGLVKLGAISPFVVLAVVSAGGINLISRMLATVRPVELKPIEKFGISLGAVSASMIWGLIKLGAISPFVVLGVVSAGGINLISRMLNKIPLINSAVLQANAIALSSTSWTYAKAFAKLLPVAVLTPTALLAAGGIWSVTRMLKNVSPLNAKLLKESAEVVSSTAWPYVKAFLKMQLVAPLAPLALVAAAGILGVTKMLSSVPKLNAANLITSSVVLNTIAKPFRNSLANLSLVGILAPLSILAAVGILKVTTTLNKIPKLNTALLLSTALILTSISGAFGKSMIKLGIAGFFAPLAIIAAKSIGYLTNILQKLPVLNTKVLVSTAQAIGSSSSNFMKGMIKLSVLNLFALPALLGAKAVMMVTKMLANVPVINKTNLLNAASTISAISGPFTKGMLRISLLGILIGPALIGAVGIRSVTKILSTVPFLNPTILISNANVISRMSGPTAKGLAKLSLIAILAAPAIFAATSLNLITKLLSGIPMLNPVKIGITATTISKMAGPMSKGLAKLSIISLFAAPALLAAYSLNLITKTLAGIAFLSPAKFLINAMVLSSTTGPMAKGLMKLSLISLVAAPALVAALALLGVTKTLSKVPVLTPAKFNSLALTLSNTAGSIAKGFAKLSIISFFAAPALLASIGLLGVTKILSNVPFISPMKFLMLATTLSSTSGKIAKGLIKLSTIALFTAPALIAAVGLLGVSKILSGVSLILPFKFMMLASSLLTASKMTKSLAKFSIISLFSGPAILAALGILGVSKLLQKVPFINPVQFIILNRALQFAGNLTKSLVKFSLISLVTAPAIIASLGLLSVTKILSKVPMLTPQRFMMLAFTLSSTSGAMAKGFAKLSVISVFSAPALVASLALFGVAKVLSKIPMITPLKFIMLASTLTSTAGPIAKGLMKFSTISIFAAPSLLASIGLLGITKILSKIPLITPSKFLLLANTLSTTTGPIAKGLYKFSTIALVVAPALLASAGLLGVTKMLSKMPVITPMKFMLLAMTLSSTVGPISRGLAKLSVISIFAAPALIASMGLLGVTKILKNVPLILPNKFMLLGASLTAAGKLTKSLAKFSIISIFAAPALIASLALLKVAQILAKVPMILPIKFISLAQTLEFSGRIAKGLTKLSFISFVSGPALIAALALLGITKTLSKVPVVFPAKFAILEKTLSLSGAIAKGLVKLGSISAVSVPALIASRALEQITKNLSRVSILNPVVFKNVAQVLSLSSAPLKKGLSQLGTMATVVGPAILVSKSLEVITRFLSRISSINPTTFKNASLVLGSTVVPISKGISNFAPIAANAGKAESAAKSLELLTKTLSRVSPVNPTNLRNAALTIGSSSGQLAKGLAKMALIPIVAGPALSAAKSIELITKILSKITQLNPNVLKSVSQSIGMSAGSLVKGIAKLSLITMFSGVGLSAAKTIDSISKSLSKITKLNPETLKNVSQTIGANAGALAKGIGKLGLISILAAPALIAAKSLDIISKTLAKITNLNPVVLKNVAQTISQNSGNLAKGIAKLGLVSIFAVPALVASKSIELITKTLSKVSSLNPTVLKNVSQTISSNAGALAKGIAKLGLVSFFAGPAILASKSLEIITKILSKISNINPTILKNISQTISSNAGSLAKGIAKLGLVSIFAVPAILAAKSLDTITKILSKISKLNPEILKNVSSTIGNNSGPIAKGLAKLGLITVFVGPAIFAAKSLEIITKSLSRVSKLNPDILKNVADAISLNAGKLAKGLAKFGLIYVVAAPSVLSAISLSTITKLLSKISPLNPATLKNVATTISSNAGALIKGLTKLSLVSFVAGPAILASKALEIITKSLSKVSTLNPVSLKSVAQVLSSSAGSLVKGVAKLSLLSAVVVPAILSAKALEIITKGLSKVSSLNPETLKSISKVIGSNAGNLVKGVTKLGLLSLVAGPAIFASKALEIITKGLSRISSLNPVTLKTVSQVIGSNAGSLVKGLTKLSLISAVAVPATIAAKALEIITKGLSKISGLNPVTLKSVSQVIGSNAGSLVKGMTKLGLLSFVAGPAIVASKALELISKGLSKVSTLNPVSIKSVSQVISSTAGSLVKGIAKFSLLAAFAVPAVLSAKALEIITKALSKVSTLNPETLKSVSKVIGSNAGSLVIGMTKLGLLSFVAGPAILATGALILITKGLSKISTLNPVALKSVAQVISSTAGSLVKGMTKLSLLSLVAAPAIFASKALEIITKGLSKISSLNPAALKSVSQVIGANAGTLVKGMAKLGLLSFVAGPAILATGALVVITKGLSKISTLNPVSLKSVAQVIGSTAGSLVKGVSKLSLLSLVAVPGILAAKALEVISKGLNKVTSINPETLKSVSKVIGAHAGNLVKGVTKLGLLSLVAGPAIFASKALEIITKGLSKVSTLNPVTLKSVAQVIGSTAGSLVKGLTKLSLISFVAVPAILASKALEIVSKGLSKISSLNPAALKSVSQVIGANAGTLVKGMAKLGLLSFVAGPAILATGALVVITKGLSKISTLNPVSLKSVAQVIGSTAGSLVKGVSKLSLLSLVAVPGILAAKALEVISKGLNKVTSINPETLKSVSKVIGAHAGNLVKGVTKLGLLSLVAGPAIFASKALEIITKGLSKVSTLNPVTLKSVAQVIGSTAGSLVKGLTKLSLISFVAVPAILASKALEIVSKGLSKISAINPTAIKSVSQVLSSNAGSLLKGIAKFGLLSFVAGPAIVATGALIIITKGLSKISKINSVDLLNVSKTLSLTAGSLVKGMAKLSLLSVIAAPAIIASKALEIITKALTKVTSLNPENLKTVSKVIGSNAGSLVKGVTKLGLLSFVAAPAILASKALEVITKGLSKISALNPVTLKSVAQVIGSNAGSLLKGLTKLSLLSLVAVPAILASKSLEIITKGLSKVSGLNPAALKSVSQVIGTNAGSLVKGIIKLGLLSLVSGPAILATGALVIISKGLSKISSINPIALKSIAQAVSSTAGALVKGLAKLSLISALAIPAILASKTLETVTKSLSKVTTLNPVVLKIVSQVIGSNAGSLVKGVGKLGLISLVAGPAILATKALEIISKGLTKISSLNPLILTTIAKTISSTSGSLLKGLLKLSLISFVAGPAIIAAKSLQIITNYLSRISQLNPAVFANISNTINSNSGKLAKGLAKLSLVSAVAIPAIFAAKSLEIITKSLSKVSQLNPLLITTAASTINTSALLFAKGLGKLSLVSLVAVPATIAAKSIEIITKLLTKVSALNPVLLSGSAQTINSTSGQFAKGLAKLALVSFVAAPAIIAAKSLEYVTKILAKVTQLNPAILQSISTTLNSTSGAIAKGLLKLSSVSLISGPAIIAAKSLELVSKILNNVIPLKSAVLSNFAQTISSNSGKIAKGLAKLSLVSLVAAPAIIASKSIEIVSRILSKITPLNQAILQNTSKTISVVSIQFLKGLAKLSLISFVATPALLAAKSLEIITKILTKISALNPSILKSAAQSINSTAGQLSKGLAKLSLISLVSAPAIIAAKALEVVTKTLSKITPLNPATLKGVANTLSLYSLSISKGLLKLSLVSFVAAPAIIAAKSVELISKILSNVVSIKPAAIASFANLINNTSGKITKGLAKLSLVSFVAAPAIIAAKSIDTITKILSKVSPINSVLLKNAAQTISSVSMGFVKGLAKLGLVSFVSIQAIAGSKSIELVTRILSKVSPINSTILKNAAQAINMVSGQFVKGLAKLSLVSFVAVPATIAAKSLELITKILSKVTPLNTSVLKNISSTLNTYSGSITKGLSKLSLVSFIAGPAMIAAKSIQIISKILSNIITINPNVLNNFSKAIGSSSGNILKGLLKLSLVSTVAAPAIIAAKVIEMITRILSRTSLVNPVILKSSSQTISTTSLQFLKGFAKLSLISTVAIPAIAAAKSIEAITKILSKTSAINGVLLNNSARTINTSSGQFAKGFAKLSLVSLVAIPAIAAAKSIDLVTKILSKISPINFPLISKIASSINSVAGSLAKGFAKLGLISFVSIQAIAASKSIEVVSKILSKITPVNSRAIKSVSNTINSTAMGLLKGLAKFGLISFVLAPALVASKGIEFISKILSKVTLVNQTILSKLTQVISSNSGSLLKGLIKFSALNFFIVPAIIASRGLISISNNLQSIKPVSSKPLSTIAQTLISTSSRISQGLKSLGLVAIFALPAIITAKSLSIISNYLNQLAPVSISKMLGLANSLSQSSNKLFIGLAKFSLMLPFVPVSIVVTAGLVKISNLINKIQLVSTKNLNQLGSVVNNSGINLIKGLLKFSALSLFVLPSLIVATGLVRLSRIINQIQPVSTKVLNILGNVMNNSGNSLVGGLFKFSKLAFFVLPSLISATGLVRLSKIINQIQVVGTASMNMLANVLSTNSTRILKGLMKFALIGPFSLPALASATGLVLLSRVLNRIQLVNSKNINTISSVISSTTFSMIKGMMKFASVSLFVGPAIISAIGIRKLSQILVSIVLIPVGPLVNLSSLLSSTGGNLLKGLLKWSFMLPFIAPAVIAATGVSKIFRLLGTLSAINIESIQKSLPLLSSISAAIIKFSKLGLSTPLIVSAGLGLASLSRSMNVIGKGFTSMSTIPWSILSSANPIMNELMGTLVKFGMKGLLAAPGIIALAGSMAILGRSMKGVASGFGMSTKSMADYNDQNERMRAVARTPKKATKTEEISAADRLKKSVVVGVENNAGAAGANKGGEKFSKESNKPQVVQIKPIQIDLKLNGRVLQQLLVEANYNRT